MNYSGSATANPAGSPKLTDLAITSAPATAATREFDRFRELAGRLMGVPKSELDEKLAEGRG